MQNRYTEDVGDFAKYGLMRQFNDASFRMALYEQKQIDWNGTKRFFKGMAADPTTYFGLSTLGLGVIMGAEFSIVPEMVRSVFRTAQPTE